MEGQREGAFLWLPGALISLITSPGAGDSEPGACIFQGRDWVFISVSSLFSISLRESD